MTTIGAQWQSFVREILTPMKIKPSSAQFIETRRAFYAGAASMFNAMLAVNADDISEEQGEEHLKNLSGEIDRFAADLKAGRV